MATVTAHESVSDVAQSVCRELLDCYATMGPPSRHADAREKLRAIEDAVAQLPEAQRDAVAMSRMLGMSYQAIAEELGRTESAVRVVVARWLAIIARRGTL